MENVILGKDAVFPYLDKRDGINDNVIVCGGTGCGKTMSITEPRLLETTETSLVVTVTKREIVDKYKPIFEQRGYTVYDMNLINPGENEVSFDPLKYVSSYSDIDSLAKSIIFSTPSEVGQDFYRGDPYWSTSAASLLSAEIGYTLISKVNPTFNDVIKLHQQLQIKSTSHLIKTTLDSKFDRVEQLLPNSQIVRWWNTFKQLPDTTAGCVFSELNDKLDKVFTPDIQKFIGSNSGIDFAELGQYKSVLFISTSPVHSAQETFANIIYGQIFKTLHEFAQTQIWNRLPVPVHLICDDFATGSKIMNFPEYISFFRADGISATILIQSESQLASIYGEAAAQTIINNCDTYVYMGGMDVRTVESVSQKSNIAFEDLYYSPVGEVVIIRRGERAPLVTKRYQILEDPRYCMMKEMYQVSQVERFQHK